MALRLFLQIVLVLGLGAAAPAPDQPEQAAAELERGAALAKSYCQMCHLQPDPSVYDKKTWEQHTLPWMSTKLGLKKVDFNRMPGGKYVRESKVLPSAPIITSNHWRAICRYYIETAPAQLAPQTNRPRIQLELKQFTVGKAPFHLQTPMTTLVKIIPGRGIFFVGDSLRRSLYMLNERGQEMSSLKVGLPPVALQLRPEGLYLTLIGYVAPSDDPLGRFLFIPNTAQGFQRPVVFLDHLPRPCDVQITDLNGDDREDLVVSHYGNIIGRFSWYEGLGNGQYREHVLVKHPGSICSEVRDFNRDGLPDIIVLMAQAREGVYLFTNQGRGQFKERALFRQPPVWGLNYFELADFDQDGHPDLLVANGDNAEYPAPMKPYHGVRIYLNDGKNEFNERYFFPMNGAYKAVARDFDGDGDLDVAAISFFPDYVKSPEESFVYLENQGDFRFAPSTFPECASGRWIVMDAADLEGDGDDDLVLGAFDRGPQTIPIPEAIRRKWETDGPNIVILRNNRHQPRTSE